MVTGRSRVARLPRRLLAWLALLLALLAPALPAQERQAAEYAVKAAFVFKFGEYVEWPEGAFADAASPLRIGVVGADALADELARLVAGRTMAGRTVQVRRLAAGDPVADLHLLFVGGDGDVAAALADADAAAILTVTEAPGAMPAGSMINFVVVDAKVRFDVALPAAEARRLRISSRLLAVARTVARRS